VPRSRSTRSTTRTGPIQLGASKRLGVEAELTLDRHDYKVSWSKLLDNGGAVVADEVKVELHVEAIEKQPAADGAGR
jgi:polyisoprenoid-binding protein YceI